MRIHRNQRGYSLMEMLVVVAIIGVLMLITIPNFMTMRKSTIVKGSMRQFTQDLRAARQRAVSRSSFTRVTWVEGTRQYSMEESTDNGTTWNAVGQNPRYLSESVSINNGTGAAKFPGEVVVFTRTGTARVPGGVGEVILNTTWLDIPKTSYTISIRTTGMVSSK
jgi:prepilin-type N-terminal cleavage/methylation domain-containing protein